MMSTCSNTTASSSYTCSTLVEREEQMFEYETQHLGFTPKAFCNGVYNAALEYIQKAIQEIETYLSEEYSTVMKPAQIKEACDAILSTMVSKLDKNFDIIETYLTKNVLTIPDNVLLPEDKAQAGGERYSPEQEDVLDTEIQELKDKILALKYANSKLKQEMSLIDHVQARFDQAQQQLQRLDDINSESGVSDVKDCLMFTSQKVLDLVAKVKAMQVKDKSGTMATDSIE
ncbi:protein MIS12 homolog [Mizuhopecten yessoensis]|uniref:Protein MIS12 homolog n=1 Tax=Mizuhopecten yessoensis TaxID=6573 RepID=A0A210PUS0_MIZYE|nr:protein MIS12 homolog [Mizuhopecten yessoensis]OWF40196.1 Protein MIS12-like [Mizuhopecten yessoensis]